MSEDLGVLDDYVNLRSAPGVNMLHINNFVTWRLIIFIRVRIRLAKRIYANTHMSPHSVITLAKRFYDRIYGGLHNTVREHIWLWKCERLF